MTGYTPDQIDYLSGGLQTVGIRSLNTSNGTMPMTYVPQNNQTYLTSLYTAFGASNSGIVNTTITTIFNLYAINASAATPRYIQLHNSAVVVASGAVPKMTFALNQAPTDHSANVWGFGGGQQFSLGVVYAWSSTPFTFTPVAGGDVGLHLNFK